MVSRMLLLAKVGTQRFIDEGAAYWCSRRMRKDRLMERTPLVEDIQNYAQNIVDTVREPLLILDATQRVQSANRAFY